MGTYINLNAWTKLFLLHIMVINLTKNTNIVFRIMGILLIIIKKCKTIVCFTIVILLKKYYKTGYFFHFFLLLVRSKTCRKTSELPDLQNSLRLLQFLQNFDLTFWLWCPRKYVVPRSVFKANTIFEFRSTTLPLL